MAARDGHYKCGGTLPSLSAEGRFQNALADVDDFRMIRSMIQQGAESQAHECQDEFERLPVFSPEIFAIIFDCLTGDNSALAHICLVSHTFNKLATPILYKHIRLEDGYQDQDDDCQDEVHRRLFPLTKTVITRPDLARCVRLVVFESLIYSDRVEVKIDDGLKDAFNHQIDTITHIWFNESLDGDTGKLWRNLLHGGSPQVILTILLCSLPNLEHLQFKQRNELHLFLDLVERAAFKLRSAEATNISVLQLPCSKLHSVRIISSDLECRSDHFKLYQTFFNLPHIRNFEIALTDDDWLEEGDDEVSDSSGWDVKTRSSPVEKLSFQSFALGEYCIKTIIGSCAHLKELHFTYWQTDMRGWELTPMDLLRAVSDHADSLEILHVNFHDDIRKFGWENLHPKELYFNDNLRITRSVRNLRRRVKSTAGPELPKVSLPDILPESLEELIIIACDGRVIDPLEKLGKAREHGQFQKLRRICCFFVEEHVKQSDLVKVKMPAVDIEYSFEDSATRWSRCAWQDRSEI